MNEFGDLPFGACEDPVEYVCLSFYVYIPVCLLGICDTVFAFIAWLL